MSREFGEEGPHEGGDPVGPLELQEVARARDHLDPAASGQLGQQLDQPRGEPGVQAAVARAVEALIPTLACRISDAQEREKKPGALRPNPYPQSART